MIEIFIQTKSPYKTIKYINKLKINIYKITYDKDGVYLMITKKDADAIGKYYHYDIVRIYGFSSFLKYIKENLLSFIYLITIIILIFLFTRFTVSVDVITENLELRRYIANELSKEGIDKYKFIKSDDVIELIKNNVLDRNKDILEWLNIDRKGMKYFVNIEPKIVKQVDKDGMYCNIISNKDAIVTKLITHKGVELVDVNDSVEKGDILISGDIIYNEETKKQVCAKGEVYGTTWYEVHVSIPTIKETVVKMDEKRYNLVFKFNNKTRTLFKKKYKKYSVSTNDMVNIFGFKILLQKEVPINVVKSDYTDGEIKQLVQDKLIDTLSYKLKGDYVIKQQKVLKKRENNSKIELDIFIVAEELISVIDKKD